MNALILSAASGLFPEVVNADGTKADFLSKFENFGTKPAIDDVICHFLDGKSLKDALNFIDYVRASKMKIKWTAHNVWSVRFKNKRVMDIIIANGSWRVRLVYNHIIPNYVFTQPEKETIKALIGTLRGSSTENLEIIPALS